MTDAKGPKRTALGYDVLGRVHTVAFIGVDGVTERKVRYERNEAGEKLTMTFTYDDRQCKLTGSVNYGDLDGDDTDWFGHLGRDHPAEYDHFQREHCRRSCATGGKLGRRILES